MKKICLLQLIIIFCTTTCAQNYFPTANAIWNESIFNYNSYYGLLGDTLINDVYYSKLYQFSDTTLSAENIQGYIGAIRNEGQKVFFLRMAPCGYYIGQEYIEENCPDILLYDFGANIGDTVWHNAIIMYDYLNISFVPDRYSIIEAIQIKNNRKIYSVKGPVFYNEWIEGIGSTMGLLRSITTSPYSTPPSEYNLNCFKYNDIVEYQNNPNCNKCFCTTNNISEKEFFDIFSIFPNPADNILYINMPINTEIKSVAIFSIDGKLIENNLFSHNLGELDISRLYAGAYLIQIQIQTNSVCIQTKVYRS